MADGTQFGRYQLMQKLAVGGMAEIFLAKQRGPGHFERTLVIKRILPHLAQDPKFVEMFLDEAALAAQLNHPNIAQVYDFGAEQDSYYIAMELIRGPDLANVLAACRKVGAPPPIEVALRITTQVASALDYAHHAVDDHGRALGLVHRDVSPQNVLVSYDGVVKLVDFGIAKAAGASHKTEAGLVKGKFSYMAPEQLRGDKLDGRCDEYATGLLLYELLTLAQALPGDGPSAIAAALSARIEPILSLRADLPAELAEIVNHVLRADREDRFRDCRELQEALDGWLVARGLSVRPHEISVFLAGLQKNVGAPLSPITSSAGKAQAQAPCVPPEPILTPPPAKGFSRTQPAKPLLTPPPARGFTGPQSAPLGGETAISPSATRRAEGSENAATRLRPSAATLPKSPPVVRHRFPWPVVMLAALVTASAGAWFLVKDGESLPTVKPPSAPVAHAQQTPLPTPLPTTTPSLAPNHLAPIATAIPTPNPISTPTTTPNHAPTPTPAPHHEHRTPAASVAPASLSVSSDPATEAFLDGSDLGPTPIAAMNVPAGKHTLRLANADLAISYISHLSLLAGQSHHEEIRLGKGTVLFLIKPWANVTFAGQPLGQTPLPPHPAYEGTYDVVVENPALQKTIRRKVTVEAGHPTLLKIDLTQG